MQGRGHLKNYGEFCVADCFEILLFFGDVNFESFSLAICNIQVVKSFTKQESSSFFNGGVIWSRSFLLLVLVFSLSSFLASIISLLLPREKSSFLFIILSSAFCKSLIYWETVAECTRTIRLSKHASLLVVVLFLESFAYLFVTCVVNGVTNYFYLMQSWNLITRSLISPFSFFYRLLSSNNRPFKLGGNLQIYCRTKDITFFKLIFLLFLDDKSFKFLGLVLMLVSLMEHFSS